MAKQDWNALEKKWNTGIDVTSASPEDLTSYINTKIHFYEEDNTTNANLWEKYQDDFQAFTTTNFKQSKLKYIQRLPSSNKLKPEICATDIRTSYTPPNHISTASIEPSSAVRLKSQISHPYTTEITNLIKAYASEPKYEGNGDSIDHKLSCFYHLCELTGVPEEAYPKTLSVMLTGFSKEHYLAANPSQLTFHLAIDHLRNFLEGPGYYRRNLGKLNATNLKSTISQNPNKTTSECLQFLVHTLREIQHELSEDLRNNSLHDKLKTECQGVPACRYAIANTPTKIGELLNNLQNSITAYEEEKSTQKTAHENIYFTNR
ncbi:hypothetical protein GcM1_173010 [Golovinomyces cichoracearum]|uniref:Uncharacterized protein n=1 Tax=Golovinomyces cichoracearum TaxID=62708 RepID=A0A420J613_9PEZI|nr:hypothetical protein GcM1_173010 [Golovinomyces cichoracearum]